MTIEQSLYSIDNIKKETNKKYVFVFLIFIISSIFFVLSYKTYIYSKKTLQLQLQIEEEANLKKGLIRNINKQLSDQMAYTHDDKSIIQVIKLFKEVYSEELKDSVITTEIKNKKQCFIITSLGKIKCKDDSQIFYKNQNDNPLIFALTDIIETFNGNVINKLEVNLEYLIKDIIGTKNNYILSSHNNRNHLLKIIQKFLLLEEGVIIQYKNIDIKIDSLEELIMLNNNIFFLIKLLLISTILASLYLFGNNKKVSKKIKNISNNIIMLYKADILEKELKNEIINSRIRQLYEVYKNDQYQNFNIDISLLATENKGIKDTILDAVNIAKKYTVGKNSSIITKEINDDYNTPIEPVIFKLVIISSLFIQASTIQKKGLNNSRMGKMF